MNYEMEYDIYTQKDLISRIETKVSELGDYLFPEKDKYTDHLVSDIEMLIRELKNTYLDKNTYIKLVDRETGEVVMKYFEKGDYTAVQAILDDKEREKELERAKKQLENAKNEIQGNVNEELLLIKTKRAQGLTKAGVEEIIGRYEKIVSLVEEYRLDPSALFEYAAFLWLQNLIKEL